MTSGVRGRLERIPAKGLAALFNELADRLRRREPAPLPRLTIDIGSRLLVRCELLDVATSSSDGGMTLLITGAERDGPLDLVYVPIVAVRSVTVHATEDTLHHLAFGALRPASGEAPPTSLEVRRRASAIGDKIAAVLGRAFAVTLEPALLAGDDQTLADNAELVKNLESALLSITQDEDGKAALRDKTDKLQIVHAPQLGVRVADRVLEIGIEADRGQLVVPNTKDLIARIEAAL